MEPDISTTSTIAFFLLIGFIVFVTMKGELVSYAGVLGIGPKATTVSTASVFPNASGTSVNATAANAASNPSSFGGGGMQ